MFRRRHFVLRSPFPCELLLCGTGSVDDGCSSCSSSSTGSGVLEKSGSGIETSGCSGTVRPHLVHVVKIGMAVEAIRVYQSHDPCLDRILT